MNIVEDFWPTTDSLGMTKTMACVTMALTLVAVQPLTGAADSRWETSTGGTYWTSGQELGCLGITPGEYTGASLSEGRATAVLDASGKLHVSAHGTYAWAVYPYSDSITGPFDTEGRLYFGSTDVEFSEVIEDYTPGTNWSFELREIEVSGAGGTVVLDTALSLFFAADRPGPGGVGVSVGGASCPALD